MTTIKKQFGVRLFQLRSKGGMTQAKLAETTNLSVDLISRIERGERAPSLESIERISHALGMPLSELFNFQNEEVRALADGSPESLELWKLLKGRPSKQVKKVTEIAKIVLE